jgi:glycine betaine/proline transport system permease protein
LIGSIPTAQGFFEAFSYILKTLFQTISWGLLAPPFYLTAIVIGVLGWRAVGLRFGVLSAIGLILCDFMGLWKETMETLALVIAASSLALLIAIPVGIIAGFKPSLLAILAPILDMIQTLPPYIYLLPAIALIGFGPQSALAATVLVAIPPALRLTALGIQLTPVSYLELGKASGSSPMQMFSRFGCPM